MRRWVGMLWLVPSYLGKAELKPATSERLIQSHEHEHEHEQRETSTSSPPPPAPTQQRETAAKGLTGMLACASKQQVMRVWIYCG
jgi:hypothetical protein